MVYTIWKIQLFAIIWILHSHNICIYIYILTYLRIETYTFMRWAGQHWWSKLESISVYKGVLRGPSPNFAIFSLFLIRLFWNLHTMCEFELKKHFLLKKIFFYYCFHIFSHFFSKKKHLFPTLLKRKKSVSFHSTDTIHISK